MSCDHDFFLLEESTNVRRPSEAFPVVLRRFLAILDVSEVERYFTKLTSFNQDLKTHFRCFVKESLYEPNFFQFFVNVFLFVRCMTPKFSRAQRARLGVPSKYLECGLRMRRNFFMGF